MLCEWWMAWCSLGNAVADDDKKSSGCWMNKDIGGRWRGKKKSLNKCNHTHNLSPWCRHGDKFTSDSIRRGRLPSRSSRNDDRVLCSGKTADSRGWVAEKNCCVSWLKWRLSVTFPTASHHSVLFFILSGYTSASEIRDLLVLSLVSEPVGTQPFYQFCNNV